MLLAFTQYLKNLCSGPWRAPKWDPYNLNRLIYSNWSHRLRWNDDDDDGGDDDDDEDDDDDDEDDDDDDEDDDDDDDDPWWWNLWWYWWWFWESRFQTLRFSSLSMWIIENGKSPFGILGEFPAKTL